jgi:hypothetical protein
MAPSSSAVHPGLCGLRWIVATPKMRYGEIHSQTRHLWFLRTAFFRISLLFCQKPGKCEYGKFTQSSRRSSKKAGASRDLSKLP